MTLTYELADAIARFEGFHTAGSVAQRNNNPGNLRTWGPLPTRDGYAVFPTLEAGWSALERQVDLNIARGLTLEEFFAGKPGVYGGYAPAADRNLPSNYAEVVAGWLGINSGAPLAAYTASDGWGTPQPGLMASGSPEPSGASGTEFPWLLAGLGIGLLGLVLFSGD